MSWPHGCRIVYNQKHPTTEGLLIDDLPKARAFHLGADELRIYNDAGELVHLVNFRNVLIIHALEIVGPSNADNKSL